ncbi:anchored repeat-type ABC transporter permease subunit [Actinomyces weissii]|uniref:Anchored repeat-type ABC transporter permease subunit n=1 Tax=Actinomyces weissii TaxID=675090 RepID=A0A7T7MA63_9ACTO|nr:anchored repeat-type ABC transporter permease subunit [Actinomyces weissii]QQM67172.1 anchored repeat-type ABC transporter permease subunit [Actinomyces weissii]
MLTPLDFINDLFNPVLAFLPRALLMAVVCAVVCGVVGVHVVLRGMAFIGDAVAHSVFPGLAVAFLLSGSLVLGGAVAGVATAVLVALLSQNRRLKEDSVIGVLFVGAFALGVVVIARAPGYAGSLQDFLFGSITGVPASDIPVALGGGVLVVVALALFNRPLVAVSLDRETARAAGLPVLALDVLLYVAVSLAVVISVQTIGNVLVLALLVTPAATARLLTDRLATMMLLAPAIGSGAGVVGLYLSWSVDVPTGATIVLVLTTCFALAWLLAPRHGLLSRHRLSRETGTYGPRDRDNGLTRPVPVDS